MPIKLTPLARLKHTREMLTKAQAAHAAALKAAHPAYCNPSPKGDIKARNMRNILIGLELDGPLSISDLVLFTRIHRVTVYRLLKILLENGDVVVPDRGVYALSANHMPILSNAEKKVLRRPGKK